MVKSVESGGLTLNAAGSTIVSITMRKTASKSLLHLERDDYTTNSGFSIPTQVGTAAEHLVCAELLLQGWSAFLAGPNLPYDVIVDKGNGRFHRIQVKATTKTIDRNARRNAYVPVYRFSFCKTGRNNYVRLNNCDSVALVALDSKAIAFMPLKLVSNADGSVKTRVDMKSRQLKYICHDSEPNPTTVRRLRDCGLFIEDYSEFKG